MKIAVSNIAWPADQDAIVADSLAKVGVRGLEIAPTKAWPRPLDATDAQIEAYRRWWSDRGIAIVAAQALLFGKPELTIFENATTRNATRVYLEGVIRVCAQAGAKALVFGSPKNRRGGSTAIAVDFFGALAETAHTAGTHLVMEANPVQYGTDFITTAADAIALVKAVNHPGFRLHLDSACMALANDETGKTFDTGFDLLRHFHASEPNLQPVQAMGSIDHAAFAGELRRRGFEHWVSLEMRQSEPFMLDEFLASVRCVQDVYGD